MEQALIEAGVEQRDEQAIKLKLRQLKYHTLLVKGPHTSVRFRCEHGHDFWATPVEAINDGCPECALLDSIKNDPAPVYSFAEFEKAVNKQQDFLKKVLQKARSKLRSRKGGPRYSI